MIVDEEGQLIPSTVSVQFQFFPMGEDLPKVEDQNINAQDGKFVFTFPQSQLGLNKPGLLKAFFEARAMVSPAPAAGRLNLVAKKFISGVILGEFQFQASKGGYKFLKAEVRGRAEKEQPVKVSASAGTDIKEVEISVIALQLDENGKLVWKGLENAEIELLNVGTRKTNKDGALIWKLADKGETVSINFYLVPDLEIKVTSLPKAYIAHPDASGKIYIFIGSKNGFEVTTDKDGNPIAQTKSPGDFVVADRRFKVSVVSGGGSLEGDIASPEPLDKTAHTIVYHPPQSLMEREEVREVKLAIEDSEIPLYKAELTLKVFKNAFITVRKLGFREDVEPVPIDLVEVNGIKVVPGTVEGKVQENPEPESGRPINGVTVTAHVADQTKETQTDGNIGPAAGSFTLRQIAENDATLRLQKPIVLPFLDFVEEFAHAFDELARLGYPRPHFREQDGFVDANNQPIFRYRWDLRYETDSEKLQRILDSIRRADAALRFTAEVDPLMKQYYKELVGAVVDLVLFFAGEFKLFGKLAEMMSVGKGIGKGVKLSKDASKVVKSRLADTFRSKNLYYDQRLLDQYVDEILPEALRNHKGLTDEAIAAIKARANTLSGPAYADAVESALVKYRDNLSEATELMVAGLKADVLAFIKAALKKMGIDDGDPSNPILKANKDLLEKIVDSALNAVISLFFSGEGSIPSPEAIFGLADKITDKIADTLMLNDRQFFKTTVDLGFKELGRYNIKGDTNDAIKRIEGLKRGIDKYRNFYEVARAPFSSAASALTDLVKKTYENMTGLTWEGGDGPIGVFAKGLFEDTANLTGSVADGILPIGSGATVVFGLYALRRIKNAVSLAWVYATGWTESDLPSDLISPFFPFPPEQPIYAPFFPFPPEHPILAYATATVTRQFAPIRSRSRQLDEFTSVVNQVKSALQNGDYERVMQLARNLSEATAAVSDALEAKHSLVLTGIPVAYEKDKTFPARARQATDAVERSIIYQREFLLRVSSYLAAESDDADEQAIQAADNALAKTQEAMGLLDGAIQQLQSLGVTLPHLLRFTHQVQQVSLTEWRITFTVQNIGGQTSPATNVKFVTTEGITVSPNSWSVPPLAPNATQTITVTARTPQRFRSGFGVIRTTLGTQPEEFNANFVPTIVFLTSKDEIPPVISDPTPKEDEVVRTATPTIAVTIADFLSGLDISSLKMTLDGQRVNATYEIATRRFSYRSTQQLAEGTHTVVVEATDLDGNTARKEWRFTVRLGAPVEISDLKVSPNPFSPNGDGIDDVLNIHFRLSGDAVLTITVVDSQNNVVKTLASEQPFTQGEHNLTWDGKMDNGETAPTGSYGVRIAIIREGRQTNVVEAQVTADQEPLSITGVSVTPERMRLTKDTLSVAFNLSQDAKVAVKVYLGENTEDDGYAVRTIVLENAKKGANAVSWDGKDDNGRFVAPGTYTVAIEADVSTLTSRVPLAGKVTVLSLPDLLAASVGSVDRDGRSVLTAVVRNIGAEPAKNIVVRFAVRDITVGDVTIPALEAGSETSVELPLDPTRQQLIAEDITATVDPDNQIEELEEFNNTIKTRLEIQAVRLAHVLPAGVSLVSVPIQLFEPSPQAAFGFASPEETKVAWWDPQKPGDLKYRYANEIPVLEPGKGYFVKLPAERTIQWTGLPARIQGNQYVINLQQGWNLIGLPRLGNVPLTEVRVKRSGDQTAAAFTTINNGIVEPYAWTYSSAERRYQLVYPEVGELGTFDAFKGYWVYAHQPCQLLIPAQSRSVLVTRKRSQMDGWFFRIEAEAGEFRDVVVVGKNANRLWAQKPPTTPEGQPVRLSLVDDQGRSWGAALADSDGRMRWRLLLEIDKGVEKVALKFPDLGYLPKGLSAYLVDEATGQRRYLRTTPAVNVILTPNRGSTEQRSFQLVIVPGETGLLRIVGLKVEPLRGRGASIQFTLTRPAQTQIEVLTLTGRRLTVIESGQNRSAGRHQIIWQGRNNSEVQLPASVYLIRITATDDEGRQVQASTAVRLR